MVSGLNGSKSATLTRGRYQLVASPRGAGFFQAVFALIDAGDEEVSRVFVRV
jgi:hypothetical protein